MVHDPEAKVVRWPATLHFGPYKAIQVVKEAQSDQLGAMAWQDQLCDCLNCILQFTIVANK